MAASQLKDRFLQINSLIIFAFIMEFQTKKLSEYDLCEATPKFAIIKFEIGQKSDFATLKYRLKRGLGIFKKICRTFH